ncbi:MAG TPA: sigma-70 family RNA polymerase sigma factor [Caulobacteraceae bacterium]|nr:sigma-70 family RNA polymerase sigma factor [Caulobacteraceae bacterium]
MAQPPEPLKDAGEPVQADSWMAQYGPALRRYFAKRVPPAEAEDLVQDVFLAMQVRGEIRDPDQADRYLFRVAANALARRRQRQRWDWAHHEELDGGFAPRDELHPERIMLDRERLAQFTAALDSLPPRMGEAFILHRFEEMTYREIARRMGVSVRTVEHFVSRAMRRIHATLEASA